MKVFVVACALLSVAFAQTVPSTEQTILHECFEKDSISCVQQTVTEPNYQPLNSNFSEHLNIHWTVFHSSDFSMRTNIELG